MTSDQDLQPGQPVAIRRSRGAIVFLLTAGLCMACAPVMASNKAASKPVIEKQKIVQVEAEQSQQIPAMPPLAEPQARTASADAKVKDAKPAEVVAAGKDGEKKGGLRAMASGAAASTLTLLLPRVAAGDDALPLLGRSTLVANDLGRLLSGAEGSEELEKTGASEKVQSVLKRALTLLGTPYRWGGTSPDSGFDCSGLVGYVFRTALGIELPRVSRDMARKEDALLIKNREDLREGDLVFFGRNKSRVDHVGIYVGDGKFLHAPRTGKDVQVSSLINGYWSTKFMQARRVEM